jgi:hypothetical protein
MASFLLRTSFNTSKMLVLSSINSIYTLKANYEENNSGIFKTI